MRRGWCAALLKCSLLFLGLLSEPYGAALADSPSIPAGFAFLREIDPTIRQEIRYAGDRNFINRPLPGYGAPECILKERAALALRDVQKELAAAGLSLKVFDCYRPRAAVKAMNEWATGDDGSAGNPNYFPNVDKGKLVTLGYVARRSAHSTGTAVDLTLVKLESPSEPAAPMLSSPCTDRAALRSAPGEIDMGTGFDCFDPKSHTNADVTPEQRNWRTLLVTTMTKHGFVNYRREWWHFSFADRRESTGYFDFPILAPENSQPTEKPAPAKAP